MTKIKTIKEMLHMDGINQNAFQRNTIPGAEKDRISRHRNETNAPSSALERIRNCKVILQPIALPVGSINKYENFTNGNMSNVKKSQLMRKCRVLLKRIEFPGENIKEQRRSETTSNFGRENQEKNIPVALRKCVVRIKRTPLQIENGLFKEDNINVLNKQTLFENVMGQSSNTFSGDANKEYIMKNTPLALRKCVVRIERTPLELENRIFKEKNPNDLSNRKFFSKTVESSDTEHILNPINCEPAMTCKNSNQYNCVENNTVQNLEHNVNIGIAENVPRSNVKDYPNSGLVKEKHNKFFHRELKAVFGPSTIYKNTSPKSPQKNIFDFLSESQNQIVQPDDIIQRLIDEGKVVVATNSKGKGRPKIKRKAIVKKKTRQVIQKKKLKTTIKNKNDNLWPNIEFPQSTLEDGANIHGEISNQNIQSPSLPKHHRRTPIHSPDGTFSRLARSVLIHQTSQLNMNQQKKLLDAARKFVSTPIKDQSLPPTSEVNISPIALANSNRQTETANKSPWRVDQNAQLPVAFSFSTNSSNLPSFSSDVILPIGKENQMKSNSLTRRSQIVESLNNSNGENIPPVPPSVNCQVSTTNENDSNANIFNFCQCPNPRQGVQKRSPLKPINILEVVTLPPIDVAELQSKNKNSIGLESDNTPTLISSSKNSENQWNFVEIEKIRNYEDRHTIIMGKNFVGNKITPLPADSTYRTNLFGFEEYLDDETDSPNYEEQGAILSANESLREKLKELKKWRPDDQELLPPATTRVGPLFDDIGNQAKQRSLKEMLCSTMINSSTGRVPVRMFEKQHCTYVEEQRSLDENNSQLFKDLEAEVTFKDQEPRRTYGRQLKKKRKIRHNFIMFMDSDESNSEDEDDSHEEIKIKEKGGQKRKVQHKEAIKDAELDTFISEFNDMCKDVDGYKFVIE